MHFPQSLELFYKYKTTIICRKKNANQVFTIGDDETYFEKAPWAKSALAERSVTYHELLDNTQKGFESGNRLENGCEAYGNQQKMMA